MELKERIKALRKALGLSQSEFGKRLGKALRTIQNWELGVSKIPESELRLIAETFNISYHWLKTGEGEMFEKEKGMRVEDIIYAHQQKMKENYWLVPVVGRAGAGFPESPADVEVLGYVEVCKIAGIKPNQLFAVEIHGNSMEPTLQEGDKVVAKIFVGNPFDINNNKIVVVANGDGELMVKRLRKLNGQIVLVSDNPAYPPLEFSEHRIVGIGVMVLKAILL